MANIQSQIKRNRQNEKKRLKNLKIRSSIRTANKKVLKATEAKDVTAEEISALYKNFVKAIDAAAQKGIVKPNSAARRKARLAKKVNVVIAQPASEQS